MKEFQIGRIEQLTTDARTPVWKETAGNLSIGRKDAKGELCAACQKRPATQTWVGEGGSLALVHGMYQHWCEFCVVSAQIEYARKIIDNFPALQARLIELSAQPETVAAVDPVGERVTE